MKKNFWVLIILIVLICGSTFYWFQWRPTKIRHDCSWVKRTNPAVPAQPAVTKEEAKTSQLEYDSCIKNNIGDQNTWGRLNKQAICENLLKQEKPAIPAKSETEWYQKANKNEYDFCIHEKGL